MVFPAGELGAIPRLAEQISHDSPEKNSFPDCMLDIDEQKMKRMSSGHLEYLSDISDSSQIVIDKLPHNFLFLGLIELLFPGAKILHCRRDPLDTCLSNYFQYFSSQLDYPYDLDNIVTHYKLYLHLMAHWNDVIKIPMLDVKYEELVCNQENVTSSILSFLGLSMEDACMRFNETKGITRTASYDQVREGLYTRSIGRWRHYEKHIGSVIKELTFNG